MKILVCGGRDYTDAHELGKWLDGAHERFGLTQIIHGAARGADTLAGEYAKSNNIPVREFPADWKENGKAAGPIRNWRMLDEGKPDIILAMPGGRGTADMVQRSKKAGFVSRGVAHHSGVEVLFSKSLRFQVHYGSKSE